MHSVEKKADMSGAMVQKGQAREGPGYNERLFSGGLRKWLHEARFLWLADELGKKAVQAAAIVEVGCFDCRALNYIGPDFGSYRGFDADWEGGLSTAAAKLADPRVSLQKCTSPQDFDPGQCDIVISLETLEHINPGHLPIYYGEIDRNLRDDGVFLISVPNETGPLFLAKQLYKSLFLEGAREYSSFEMICQTFGAVGKVKRREHKGFGWRTFKKELSQYFDVRSVRGLQFPHLPLFLNPSIGIVATRKGAGRKGGRPA